MSLPFAATEVTTFVMPPLANLATPPLRFAAVTESFNPDKRHFKGPSRHFRAIIRGERKCATFPAPKLWYHMPIQGGDKITCGQKGEDGIKDSYCQCPSWDAGEPVGSNFLHLICSSI